MITLEEFDKITAGVPLWWVERAQASKQGQIDSAIYEGSIRTLRDALDTGVNRVELYKGDELVASGYWNGEIVDGEKTYHLSYEGKEIPVDTEINRDRVRMELSRDDMPVLVCEVEEPEEMPCPMCKDGKLHHAEKNGTNIYACTECQFIGLEYYDVPDADNLVKYIEEGE